MKVADYLVERLLEWNALQNRQDKMAYVQARHEHGQSFTGIGYSAPQVVPQQSELNKAAAVLNAGEKVGDADRCRPRGCCRRSNGSRGDSSGGQSRELGSLPEDGCISQRGAADGPVDISGTLMQAGPVLLCLHTLSLGTKIITRMVRANSPKWGCIEPTAEQRWRYCPEVNIHGNFKSDAR